MQSPQLDIPRPKKRTRTWIIPVEQEFIQRKVGKMNILFINVDTISPINNMYISHIMSHIYICISVCMLYMSAICVSMCVYRYMHGAHFIVLCQLSVMCVFFLRIISFFFLFGFFYY